MYSSLSSKSRDIVAGAIIALFCILLQNSSSLLSLFVAFPLKFESVGKEAWKANIDSLAPGEYYASIGRPKAPCSLILDNKEIDTNRSEIPETRNKLFLGAGFIVSNDNSRHELSVVCDKQKGFVGLTHQPVVAKYSQGMLLQIWRQVTELLLGPLSSLFLIFFSIFLFLDNSFLIKIKKLSSRNTYIEGLTYFTFGVVVFSYSLSLAYIPRLFISGLKATFLHIFLRNAVSLFGLIIFVPKFRKLISGQVILLLTVPLWAIFYPNTLVNFYHWEFLYCPLSTGLAAFFLFKQEPRSSSQLILRVTLVAWTIVQSLDFVSNWGDFGAYSAPSVILFLCLSAFNLKRSERSEAFRIETAVRKILQVIESELPIQSVLREISLLIMKEAKYSRVSSYVDGFCLGAHESPTKYFFRISENGYKKDTAKDSVIIFSEGRGQVMVEAISHQRTVLRIGKTDSAWFLIAPIGRHSCINLSDDKPKSDFIAYESLEIVQRIFPSLLSLERRLIDLGFQQGAALQKLRSKRGDGKWEEELGSIFVDINDFSKLADAVGDAFTTFISNTYIPAMIKAASRFAVSEHVAGDEVYFIVTKDLTDKNLSIQEGTIETLQCIDSFAANEGAQLCVASGFNQITVSIGIAVGIGTIISDPVSVRTTGKLVNHAKRLQEEAGKSGILISSESNIDFKSTPYLVGEEVLIQKKKQVIRAKKILRRSLIETKISKVG